MRGTFTGSNNFENMECMVFGVNTKYVLGLPWATLIGLEHVDKKPKDYDHRQPVDTPPPWFDRGQKLNVLFLNLPFT